jgi:hypothetical protein
MTQTQFESRRSMNQRALAARRGVRGGGLRCGRALITARVPTLKISEFWTDFFRGALEATFMGTLKAPR